MQNDKYLNVLLLILRVRLSFSWFFQRNCLTMKIPMKIHTKCRISLDRIFSSIFLYIFFQFLNCWMEKGRKDGKIVECWKTVPFFHLILQHTIFFFFFFLFWGIFTCAVMRIEKRHTEIQSNYLPKNFHLTTFMSVFPSLSLTHSPFSHRHLEDGFE